MRKRLKHNWGKLIGGLVFIAVCGWFVYAYWGEIDRELIIDYSERIPALWFIAGFFILPLLGFPISLLLLVAGMRFGLVGGMAVATVGMFFHNYAAYLITHGLFRDRVRAFLERCGYGIPPVKEKHRVWFTALFAAVHGPPYAPKLYSLALTDIPLRVYLGVGAPVYIFFALVPVGAGSAVTRFAPMWIYVFAVIAGVISLIGYWLHKRFSPVVMGDAEAPQ